MYDSKLIRLSNVATSAGIAITMTRTVTFLGLLLLSACVQSQPKPTVHLANSIIIDEQGTCDHAKLLQLPDITSLRGIGYTFVIAKDTKLFRSSAQNAEKVSVQPEIFEKAVIFGTDDDTSKILAALRSGTLCGWLEPAALFKPGGINRNGPKALRVKDGPDKARFPDNTLNLKVLLQNKQITGNLGVPLFEKPGAAEPMGGPNGRKSLFNVYEVFEVQVGTDTSSGGRNRQYYLIGNTEDLTGSAVIIGWVKDDDVFVWDNRVAAFWNGTVKAKGYYTEELLSKKENPIITSPERYEEPDNVIAARFPVLSQSPTLEELLRRNGTRADGDLKIKYYRVAMPGICERQQPGQISPSTWQCIAETEDVRKVIEKAQRLNRVDILFLIDATESMTQYLSVVARNVNRFIKTLNSGHGAIRVGVAIYGDYKGSAPSLEELQYQLVVPFVSLDGTDLPNHLADLDSIHTFHDPQQDLLEAPYAAIIKAAHEYSRSTADIRLIVHVADHGNRKKNHTSEEYNAAGQLKSSLMEIFDEDRVVKALQEANTNYVPIAVRGNFIPEVNSTFRDQATTLYRLDPEHVAPLAVTYDSNTQTEREEISNERIFMALKGGIDIPKMMMQENKTPSPKAIDVAEKPLPEPKDVSPIDAPSYWGRIVKRLTREYGLNDKEIGIIQSHTETVDSYYFGPSDENGTQPVFTFWIALHYGELQKLQTAALDLCDNIDVQGSASTALESVLIKVLEAASGDYGNPAELFEKRLFIPAIYLDPLLKKSWKEIEAEVRNAHELNQNEKINGWKKKYCKSAFLLNLLLRGYKVDESDIGWDAEFQRYTSQNGKMRKYQWWLRSDAGTQLYYIPISYLP